MLGVGVNSKRSLAAGKNRSAWFTGFVKSGDNPIAAFLPTQAWEAGASQEDLKFVDSGANRYGFYAGTQSGDRRIGYCSTPIASYPSGWTKHVGAVIDYGQVSGVDDVLVSAPVPVAMQDGSFRLYAHAYNGSEEVGVVYSATASGFPNTWTYVQVALDHGAGGSWCSATVRPEIIVPSWLAPDGLWHCIFGGNNAVADTGFQGGHAKCADGLAFVKDSSPVLTCGTGWDKSGVHPVGGWCKVGTTFYFLFQGFDGSHWRVGVFETDDFASWYKWPYPVLELGSGADVDAGTVENPGLVYDPATGTLDLWYCANNPYGTSAYKICFARATGQVPP